MPPKAQRPPPHRPLPPWPYANVPPMPWVDRALAYEPAPKPDQSKSDPGIDVRWPKDVEFGTLERLHLFTTGGHCQILPQCGVCKTWLGLHCHRLKHVANCEAAGHLGEPCGRLYTIFRGCPRHPYSAGHNPEQSAYADELNPPDVEGRWAALFNFPIPEPPKLIPFKPWSETLRERAEAEAAEAAKLKEADTSSSSQPRQSTGSVPQPLAK
ncbi:uncharacterized protein RCC_04455 [Ramularia collo-cygni]|uniref:Uncharacterized protein n=1 Tax=Ramularia collo-cygni TaxID=112498 RepID=A0A2D3URH9_9PEZI|nr:uncharacterized protein RCC_04455 [Ramularia collo-cygni]CZT18611.1 uncharacterized protein RCC_04455 [Ramularia collo-cygni]